MAEENQNNETELDLTNPTVKAAVERAAEERLSSFESEKKKLLAHNQKVIEEKRAEAQKRQEYEQMIEQLGGLEEIERIRTEREALADTEDADLYRSNPDKWFEKRAENLVKKTEKQLQQIQQELDKERGSGDKWRTAHDQLLIQTKIQQAQENKGFNDDARPVAARLLATEFTALDEEGNPVKLDAHGEPVLGPDGIRPLTLQERIDQLAEEVPSLFKSSAGGGASGNRGFQSNGLPRGVKSKKDLVGGQRIKMIRENPDLYNKLPNS